jgi:hypothetical protein
MTGDRPTRTIPGHVMDKRVQNRDQNLNPLQLLQPGRSYSGLDFSISPFDFYSTPALVDYPVANWENICQSPTRRESSYSDQFEHTFLLGDPQIRPPCLDYSASYQEDGYTDSLDNALLSHEFYAPSNSGPGNSEFPTTQGFMAPSYVSSSFLRPSPIALPNPHRLTQSVANTLEALDVETQTSDEPPPFHRLDIIAFNSPNVQTSRSLQPSPSSNSDIMTSNSPISSPSTQLGDINCTWPSCNKSFLSRRDYK